jgi:hypothetical protein
MCETGPAVPWQRIQNLLVTPLFPEKKKAATVNQANSEVLTTLVKNWLYGPAEVRRVDGTPLTGAELETVKAQIKASIGKTLARRIFVALCDDIPTCLFQRIQKRLEPKPKLYERITITVYNELRRSGRKDINKKLLEEEVGRECRRLNLIDPTLALSDPPSHFGKILKACDLGNLKEARRGRKPGKREKNLGTKTC